MMIWASGTERLQDFLIESDAFRPSRTGKSGADDVWCFRQPGYALGDCFTGSIIADGQMVGRPGLNMADFVVIVVDEEESGLRAASVDTEITHLPRPAWRAAGSMEFVFEVCRSFDLLDPLLYARRPAASGHRQVPCPRRPRDCRCRSDSAAACSVPSSCFQATEPGHRLALPHSLPAETGPANISRHDRCCLASHQVSKPESQSSRL